ncbi:MAG: histidine ammonia-lyase [Pseudomonadota bacterium]
MITLVPGQVSLAQLRTLYKSGNAFALDSDVRGSVERSANIIADAARGSDAIYGINTGFGKLASVRIAPEDTKSLQRKIILSHCAGTGAPIPPAIVRLIMALKVMSLGRGASGARWAVIEALQALVANDIIPLIPSQGSVGASGDLAPLAHMTAPLLGEGEVIFKGERMPAGQALSAAGLDPIALSEKEGLAMINGTQVSTALALAGFFDAWDLVCGSLTTGALSVDAAMGTAAPFHPDIQTLRGHRGQIDAAARLRHLLDGSKIAQSHKDGDERVQDPYCLRCQPQVIGACIDVLRQVAVTLCTEANAATDNPLVMGDGSIVSGGNFHAEPVAFAADQIAMVIAEAGCIAQRRIALLVDPALSFGLPAFLSPSPGLNSGLMIAEVTSAALMSENKALANPRCVDSTPTSANQEDHVSMACHAARRLSLMNDNLAGIVAIEAMTAVQGIECRAPLVTSARLGEVIGEIRGHCKPLEEDRILSPDIAALTAYVRGEQALADSAGAIAFEPA